VQLQRGARNIFRLGDGDKITKVAEFHIGKIIILTRP